MTDRDAPGGDADPSPAKWQDPERQQRKVRLHEYLSHIVDVDSASWNDAAAPGGLWEAPPLEVPRLIWLYWHQGWQDAPDIARLCRDSWRAFNPGFEVRAIDYAWVQATYGDELRLHPKVGVAGFSDRLRTRLLSEHGGVWADATIFCSQPLDAWVNILLTPARFFAFADPTPDRIAGTWFLAATAGSPLMVAWDDVLREYLAALEREDRTMHAYFFTHYVLEYVVRSSAAMRAWWEAMPKVSIAGAVALGRFARLASKEPLPRQLDEADRAHMRALLAHSPLHRLTRKGSVAAGFPNASTTIDLLAEHLASADGSR